MRSYPIWNEINSCAYKGNKSYGVKRVGDVRVLVGSSAQNSHDFVRHATVHLQRENGDREFRFYVDNALVKKAIPRKGASELEFLEVE